MNITKPLAIDFFLWEDFKKRNDWAGFSTKTFLPALSITEESLPKEI